MIKKVKYLNLPSVLSESSWFYKKHEEELKEHLGKSYLSYSSKTSFESYREDFIKQKFCGIKLPDSIYASLGSYCGEAVELGKFPKENPWGFTGQENLKLDEIRPKNAEYEKLIVIDRGSYIIIGFIDIYEILKEVEGVNYVNISDLKTGGSKKEKEYENPKYIQVILYTYGRELKGDIIKGTGVEFVRRTGSHLNLPLHISDEQFYIPLEYNEDRIKYALDVMDKVAKQVSEYYTVYLRYFAQ